MCAAPLARDFINLDCCSRTPTFSTLIVLPRNDRVGPGRRWAFGGTTPTQPPTKIAFSRGPVSCHPLRRGELWLRWGEGESQIFQNLVQAFGAVECVVVFKFDFRDVFLIQARCQFITDCFGYFVQSALNQFNVWVARVIIQMHKLGAATRSRTNQ